MPAALRSISRAFRYRAFHSSSIWAGKRVLQSFKLADIGEGITECEVIRWSVTPSSSVQSFDPLCEVQSDKASVELTSPFDGIVKELLVKEGEIAKVGADLCIIEVEEETSDAVEAPQRAEQLANETSSSTPPSSLAMADNPPSPPRRPHPLDPNALANEGNGVIARPDGVNVLALPSVRHFAKTLGVDIAQLSPGSGRGGRVEKTDIDAFISQGRVASTITDSILEYEGVASTQARSEEDVVVELGRTRHNMWKAMVKSLEIPHFGYSTYMDLTSIHNILPTLNAHIPEHYLPPSSRPLPLASVVNPSSIHPAPTPPNVPETGHYTRLTYLPVLLKTLSLAMRDWPLFRASITPSEPASSSGKPTLTVRPHADISIALSTPTGLYTPTLQRANTHSIYSLASNLAHLASLGRRTPCGLSPAEMPRRGGTITVSNVGAIGKGEFAQPVLVPGGGVAIVAIGRARWVKDEEKGGERRFRVGVSWSADHRVVEGAELAAFVECWRSWVEHPERLIAEGV